MIKSRTELMRALPIAALIAACAFAAAPVLAAPIDAKKGAESEGKLFKCEGGREMVAEFSTRGNEFVATVDTGEGEHVLTLKPGRIDVPEITWSDGKRTLTWSAGVQLMFMDGSTHLMCGRGGHEH
ncbi:hypothetical protein BH11PSE2_BH11PSE2_18110 [soil metagenome]